MNSSFSSIDSKSHSIYSKIVFLGNLCVGKSSIIRRIFDQEYTDEYLPTIGLRIYNLNIKSEKDYFIQLWDVSGSNLYSDFLPVFIKSSDLVVLIFDYKNKDSQSELIRLYEEVCRFLSPEKIIIVGNKNEAEKGNIPKLLISWAKQFGIVIYSVSALENKGISLLLRKLIDQIDEKNLQ